MMKPLFVAPLNRFSWLFSLQATCLPGEEETCERRSSCVLNGGFSHQSGPEIVKDKEEDPSARRKSAARRFMELVKVVSIVSKESGRRKINPNGLHASRSLLRQNGGDHSCPLLWTSTLIPAKASPELLSLSPKWTDCGSGWLGVTWMAKDVLLLKDGEVLGTSIPQDEAKATKTPRQN